MGALSCLPAARAQTLLPGVRPWRPTTIDSTSIWVNEARARLEASTNQMLADEDLRAYSLLNRFAQDYFKRLGPRGMAGAAGLHTALDTLGLRIEMAQDPDLPAFTLVHFLNPVSEGFASLAYLYWFRGTELLSQPINLRNGRRPRLRVFWTGSQSGPYEAGLIHHEGVGIHRSPVISTMRLTPNASAWLPVQMGVDALRPGGVGEAVWVDIDSDGIPEAASWTEADPGPPFHFCEEPGCPRLLAESLFARRSSGDYGLVRRQELASPLQTLVAFIQAVRRKQDAEARALSADVRVIQAARDMGWEELEGEGAVRFVRDRDGKSESVRIRLAYQVPGGELTPTEVYFVNHHGEWLIGEIVKFTVPTHSQESGDAPGGGGSPE
jgi:hypothetical protein